MVDISGEAFAQLITQAMEELPRDHMQAVKNVAVVWDDEPSPEQRERSHLRDDQTLLGVYEGVALTRRNGRTDFPPDKITLFRGPISRSVNTYAELKEQVKHTIWHEIAHYFGLNHEQIHGLE
ncbi:MAG TPA: metallopeptidase family protein [Candidatus Saccharimonadales bacterium]|nr:metallopeptidase family protein [Candidatus Saccharimonadales bacterium]